MANQRRRPTGSLFQIVFSFAKRPIGDIPCGLISDGRLTQSIWRELGTPWGFITLIRLAGCGTNKAATKVLLESDINAAWTNVIPSK